MEIVSFDTHMLIWGIQRRATSGQEEMIARAQALLTQLEKDRAQVVIPSIVIGEFLLGLPVNEHPRYQEIISRRFIVVPYDLRAAIHFSRIWHKKKDTGSIEEIQRTGATRTELRADAMIVATALAANATVIYGHDRHVRQLAAGFIAFRDIADLTLQMTLPVDPPTP